MLVIDDLPHILQKWRAWSTRICSPTPQPEDEKTTGLIWARSEDTTQGAPRTKCTKGPAIKIDHDDDDDDNRSNDSTDNEECDVEEGSYVLRKCAQGEGMSSSGTTGMDPPEDGGCEKSRRVIEAVAVRSAVASEVPSMAVWWPVPVSQAREGRQGGVV